MSIEVYAAQPREGTETISFVPSTQFIYEYKVYAAQPREGTETSAKREGSD